MKGLRERLRIKIAENIAKYEDQIKNLPVYSQIQELREEIKRIDLMPKGEEKTLKEIAVIEKLVDIDPNPLTKKYLRKQIQEREKTLSH